MTPNYLCSPKALRNIVQSLGTPAHFRLLLLLRVRPTHPRIDPSSPHGALAVFRPGCRYELTTPSPVASRLPVFAGPTRNDQFIVQDVRAMGLGAHR